MWQQNRAIIKNYQLNIMIVIKSENKKKTCMKDHHHQTHVNLCFILKRIEQQIFAHLKHYNYMYIVHSHKT